MTSSGVTDMKIGKAACQFLRTKAADLAPIDDKAAPAIIQLGGTRLYAPHEEVLTEALECISKTTISIAGEHCCITPNHLFGLCRKELPVDKKIFRACMNAEARMGRIELVRCLSERGHSFRVVIEASNLEEFRKRLAQVLQIAREKFEINVREIQDLYYPQREKGTWFISQQLLQRVAYLGYLFPKDKWSFQIPDTLLNAKAEFGGEFRPIEPARLA